MERRIPPGYVEYLEEQQRILVKALKKTWQQYAAPGSRLHKLEDPPVHSIMEDLGVLAELTSHNPDREDFHFEEDLEKLRQQCEMEAEATDFYKLSRSSSSCSSIETPHLSSNISFNEPWAVTPPPAKQMKTVHQRMMAPLMAPLIARTNSTPNCWQPHSGGFSDEQVNPFGQVGGPPQQQQYQQLRYVPSALNISVPQSMMDWSFGADITPTNPTMPSTPSTPMNPTWQNMQAAPQMFSFGSNNDFGTLDDEWRGWIPDRSMSV